MPTYEYKCLDCGEYITRYNSVDARRINTPKCQCGGNTEFKISMPMIASAARFENYKCPVTGDIVTSQKKKKYIEDKNDLIIVEKGMGLTQAERQAKRQEVKNYKDHLPDELKPELQKELQSINN